MNQTDHFYLSSPHAAPPQPSDWLPASTSPRRTIPYHYATLIDHPAFASLTAKPQHGPEEPKVPKELKTRLKKAHGAMEVLEELERRVREFVLDERIADESDSEEEEIVFIGRGKREAVMVASEEGDQAGGFARWVVHEVARYYGLRSWSVTEGGRRGVYVGRREKAGKVPTPLYALIRA